MTVKYAFRSNSYPPKRKLLYPRSFVRPVSTSAFCSSTTLSLSRQADLFPRVLQPRTVFRLQEDQRLSRCTHPICDTRRQGRQAAVPQHHVAHVGARDLRMVSRLELVPRLDVIDPHLAFDEEGVLVVGHVPPGSILAFGAEACEDVRPVLTDHDPLVRLRPRRADLVDVRHRVSDRPVVDQEQVAFRIFLHRPGLHHGPRLPLLWSVRSPL